MAETFRRLTSDQATTSVSFVDVSSDLSFALAPSVTYFFRFIVHFNTGANDALRLAINGPASPTSFHVGIQIPSSTTAANYGTVTAYDTAIFAATTAAVAARMAVIEGTIVTASPGTFSLRFASEAGESVSVLADSEAVLISTNLEAYLSEALTLADSGLVESIPVEQVAVSDSVTVEKITGGGGTVYDRTPSDTIDLTDTTTVAFVYGRLPSDTLSVSDSISNILFEYMGPLLTAACGGVSVPLVGPRQLRLASSSGRYLVDGFGSPVFINGDTAWSAIVQLDRIRSLAYLDDCVLRGFNALIVNLLEHHFSANPPENAYGELPFTGTAFQSSLNQDYFDHARWFVARAQERGIVIFLNPAYLGFNGGTEGWYSETEAATNGQMTTYGTNVANQFKEFENIVWCLFGDYNPPSHARTNALQTGIIAADTLHTLFGTHYGPGVSGHDDPTSWMTFDWIYKYGGFTHTSVLDGYNDTPTVPVLMCEAWYEGENSSTSLDIRRQAWGAALSGACGSFYGHRDIWGFGDGLFQVGTWQAALVATVRLQMVHYNVFFKTRKWYLLVPDQTSTFITAGRGTLNSASYVTAAMSSDDTWGAAYLPTGSTGGAITVDRTEFSGSFRWTWYNPRTGGTSGGGTSPNTGTENFTAPDTNDWVWIGEVA